MKDRKPDALTDLDLSGVNAGLLYGIFSKALADNELRKLLKIQKADNSGEKRTYYLVKRPAKKCGFIYQVKYIDGETGKALPTKYSTGTNDLETAIRFAESNRETLLENYRGRAELSTLENYFREGSKYLELEKMDGRKLSPLVAGQRRMFMVNHVIPFFQGEKVRYLSQITPIHVKQLKSNLSKKGLAPGTVNMNLHSLKRCLVLFRDMGKTSVDFSGVSFTVRGAKKVEKPRNIYPVETLKGIFSRVWKTPFHKLLCMLIYFTNMRNSEIRRIRFDDMKKTDGVWFLNVRGTKSRNAVRKVPIHPKLYDALESHIKENGLTNDKPIFAWVYPSLFRKSATEMGSMLGFTKSELVEKGICYYSGRHTYKTILTLGNATGIADLSVDFAEMFMGHSGSANLKEQGIDEYEYKHINADTIGNTTLADKGGEVLKILSHYYL